MQNYSDDLILDLDLVKSFVRDRLFSPCSSKEKVGIEIERFPVVVSDHHPYQGIIGDSRSLYNGLLLDLAKKNNWQIKSDVVDNEYVIIGYKLSDSSTITFEPGKQIEYSTSTFDDFDKLVKDVDQKWKMIADQIYQTHKLEYITLGSYPFLVEYKPNQHPLQRLIVNKIRYQFFANYFHQFGIYGERMMNHTCANQVCIDPGSSSQLVSKRYITANLIAPLVHGIFAFSPYLDGKLCGYKSSRAKIIPCFDSCRVGFPSKELAKLNTIEQCLDIEFCVNAYSNIILNSTLIYIVRDNQLRKCDNISFLQWVKHGLNGSFPSIFDLIQQAGLVFPEVRSKGFFELRSPDGQATIWQYVPAIFYLALLTNEQCLDETLSVMLKYSHQVDKLWEISVNGLEDSAFSELCQKIVQIALKGLELSANSLVKSINCSSERSSLEIFYKNFTALSRCPSDDLLDMLNVNNKVFDRNLWKKLTQKWQSYR